MAQMSIAPENLVAQPMTMRRIGDDDYAVMVAGLSVGRIMRQQHVVRETRWAWFLNGVYVRPELHPADGYSDTLDGAKAAFRERYDRWLADCLVRKEATILAG